MESHHTPYHSNIRVILRKTLEEGLSTLSDTKYPRGTTHIIKYIRYVDIIQFVFCVSLNFYQLDLHNETCIALANNLCDEVLA